ncbi:Uncharacterized protein HZ326_26747 [Fusarium oxysporum f. sp. albedinis]|nr:Uncharacterized protein HZ326_26747 [Fusarium oxysporum f. sp. albedinis]
MTWRWIPSSRPVSVVSDLLPLRRQAHEEISASNSPLSSMSLWPGLIGLMWKLRILWSGGCPAMSAECERVFSQTKKVITDERNRLKSDTVAALECQKHLLRTGMLP